MKGIRFRFKFEIRKPIRGRGTSYKSFFIDKENGDTSIFVEQIANILSARLLDSTNTKKSFDRWVCLVIPARGATLLPPVGPFLGQHGFNAPMFCTNYNNITKELPESLPLKVFIKLYTDKSIQLQIGTPPTSFLLHSCNVNNDLMGIYLEDLYKIVYIKGIDNYDIENEAMIQSIIGTMRSMKLKIVEDIKIKDLNVKIVEMEEEIKILDENSLLNNNDDEDDGDDYE